MNTTKTYEATPAPKYSPWGLINNVCYIAPGIHIVDTPSHGGAILSEERAADIPPSLIPWTDSYTAWEEDADMIVPALVFFEEFVAAPSFAFFNRPQELLNVASMAIRYRKDDVDLLRQLIRTIAKRHGLTAPADCVAAAA